MSKKKKWILIGVGCFVFIFGVAQLFLQSGSQKYNYKNFDRQAVLPYPAIEAGSKMEELQGFDLDTQRWVALKSYWVNRPIVIETGSITCPIFTNKILRMNELAKKYEDRVQFFVLYGREAHPGANYQAHEDFEVKMGYARDLRDQDGVERKIFVGDLTGMLHKKMGGFPNSVYLIGRDGVIAHRADWNEPETLEAEIEKLLGQRGFARKYEEYLDLRDNITPMSFGLMAELFRVFNRAGAGAGFDFWVRGIPGVMMKRVGF